MLDKTKAILILSLFLYSMHSYADTCKNVYQTHSFYKASTLKLGSGHLYCSYGDPNKSVSYELIGQPSPVSGPWVVVNAYSDECVSNNSNDCVFHIY